MAAAGHSQLGQASPQLPNRLSWSRRWGTPLASGCMRVRCPAGVLHSNSVLWSAMGLHKGLSVPQAV